MDNNNDNSGKRPTIEDVARLAGVSTVSVSRVLNNRSTVRERTRQNVRRAILELGYVPNPAAQMLRTNRSNMIGCVISDLGNNANAVIVQAAERRLNAEGNLLVTACSDMDDQHEAQLIELLRHRGVDGLIIQPADEKSVIMQDAVAEAGIPVVIIDRDIPVAGDRVLFNHYDAMREVTQYLLDLGHRDIAIIASEATTRPSRERIRGFVDELAARGVESRPNRIFQGSHLAEHSYNAAMTVMSTTPRPTALIAAGNLLMVGAIKALQTLKISIPDHVSFVGADDIDIATLLDPQITVVDRDLSALGRIAAEVLIRRLGAIQHAGFETITLPSRVILRRSCGPVRS
jgi:LacI family transcriptional regulator